MTRTKAAGPDPRRIDYLPLADLAPDPANPKAHDSATIHDSIGRFGLLDLIVQDQRTGRIVSGHGRHEALVAMEARGESAPEGVLVDDEGRWLVPVATGWSSRTDSEAKAALIALNRTTELGGWVDDSLIELLEDLGSQDDGLVGVGYSESDVQDLRDWVDHMASKPAPGIEVERDLDKLAETFGSPTEADELRKVTLNLPADLAERLSLAVEEGDIVALLTGWLDEYEDGLADEDDEGEE